MRPIKLTMQAFASYGERTEIDFTKPNDNLFLISGNTGAGKSTIFDAIMFALFGESSSADNTKDGCELKSCFADPKTEAFVELTFEEKGQVYKITRKPRQKRPTKTRQKNDAGEMVYSTTEEKEKVELLLPGGVPCGLKGLKEHNAKIQEIVGFNVGQFRQVGMLAQGEFMKGLRAKGAEKAEIYRKLFGTQIFVNIVEELKRRVKEEEANIKELKTKCMERLGSIRVSEEDEDYARVEELRARLDAGLTLEELDDLHAVLERAIARLERASEERVAKKQEALKARDKASQDLKDAETLLKKIDELANCEEKLRALQERQADYDRMAQTIREIDAAYEVQGVYKLFVNDKDSVDKAEKALAENQADLPRYEQDADESKKVEEEAASAFNASSESYAHVKTRVDHATTLFAELVKLAKELDAKNAANADAQRALEDAKKDAQAFDDQVEEWTKVVSEKKDAGANYEALSAKKKAFQSIEKEIEQARQAERDVASYEKRRQEAEADYQAAQNAAAQAKEDYRKKLDVYIDEQAGFLADTLEDGKPCPVCGSTHHPSPRAKSVDIRELTWDKVDALAKKRDETAQMETAAFARLQTVGANLSNARETLETKRAEIREKVGGFVELAPDFTLDDAADALHAELSRVQEELRARANDKADYDAAQKAIDSSVERKRELGDKLTQAQNASSACASAAAAAKAALDEKEKMRAQLDFASASDAQNALKAAEAQKSGAEKTLLAAKTRAAEAEKAKTKCAAEIARLQGELPTLRENCAKAEQEYRNKLDAKDLEESAWQKTVAEHEKEEQGALQKALDRFSADKARMVGACEQLRKEVEEKPTPELDALQNAFELANAAYVDIERSVADINAAVVDNRKADYGLRTIREQFAPKIKLHAQYKKLSDRLGGRESGKRAGLEMRVLRFYLEKILNAANERLAKLSDRRYEFKLKPWEEVGTGVDKALDLLVHDYNTNDARPVETLSGGESFMAAMAMALGTADAIQANSSAVRLDVMFIDEGFGSLDPSRLGEAIAVVKKCAGGNRLVGIISHVEGLKREIDEQLVVECDKKSGSRVKWLHG